MGGVPSRQTRLAHAAKHAELWNAGKKDEWVASWRTICPGEVRMFDPVGTEEKHGFDAATSDAFDMFQSILKINMITVQVNGNEMAWVCENHFGTERYPAFAEYQRMTSRIIPVVALTPTGGAKPRE